MITDSSFDSNFCILHRLGFGEIFILSEIYSWIFSDNPPETAIIENEEYYYISQTYFYEKHKSLCSKLTIKNYFKKFKEIGIIKENKVIGKLRKNYICFNWQVVQQSINFENIKNTGCNSEWITGIENKIGENKVLLDEEDFNIKPKKYSKEAENIIIDIISSNQNIFSTRVPKDLYNPTKTFSRACTVIEDIYAGRFTNPRLYHFAPDFEENKQFNVQGWKSKIKAVKGDWTKIKELLNSCVENFKLMYDPDRMPFNKNYLQTNLDKWLFDDFTFGNQNATSQFIQSLNEPMYTREKLSENKADRIFDTLSDTAKKGGNKLFELNKSMSAGVFWELVSKMVDWGKAVVDYDENVHCWIETASEIPGLFADYLIEHNITVSLSTIDIEKAVSCNGPWVWFLQEVCNKYGLNKNITGCVNESDFVDCYSSSINFNDMEEVIF